MKRWIGWTVLLASSLACSSASASDEPQSESSSDAAESAEADESEGESDTTGDEALDLFAAHGFVAQRGHASSFLVEDCAELSDCFGNNPTSPYLFFSIPAHPEQADLLPGGDVGLVPKIPEGMTPAYYLDTNEALVVRGQLPPSAKYLGLTPYLFDREVSGDRLPIFASLSDSLNHTNLQSDGATVFGSEFALVVSADASTQAAAHTALVEAGVPAEAINDLVIPSERVRLGLDPSDDTFMILGRVALFEDEAAGDAYLDAPPLEVFRLTPESSGEPLPTPQRAERGDGTDESDLTQALNALEDALKANLSDMGATPEDVQIASAAAVALAIDPERCIDMSTQCLGDNGDALYAAGPLDVFQGTGSLTLGDDEAFYLFGVNHVASTKAEYASVAVYGQAQRVGVASLNDHEMVGSANTYLPDHPDADKLFVVEVRRDCSGRPTCLEVASEFPGVAYDADLFFMFRSYVNPGLSVSPAPSEILGERALKISLP